MDNWWKPGHTGDYWVEAEFKWGNCLGWKSIANINVPIDQWSSSEYPTYFNVNKDFISVQVIFASVASLILLIIVSWFIGVPPRVMQPRASVTGISVLETLWIAAHSWSLCEHMAEVNDPSLDNLRKAGKFQICLGDTQGRWIIVTKSKAFLEQQGVFLCSWCNNHVLTIY